MQGIRVAGDVIYEYQNEYSIQDKKSLWAAGSTCAVLVANGMVTLSLEVCDEDSKICSIKRDLTLTKLEWNYFMHDKRLCSMLFANSRLLFLVGIQPGG